MKSKLDDASTRQLQVRIFVSRVTGKITETQIAHAFEISLSTLQRYKDVKWRKLSQDYARKQYGRFAVEREVNRGKCTFCGIRAEDHLRCQLCEIFLHNPQSGRCGISHDGVHCDGCIESEQRIRMRQIHALETLETFEELYP